MKNVKNNVQQLLKSYSKYYQLCFKLIVNNNEYFNNFTDEKESSILSFKIKDKDAILVCSKENFEEQLKTISIAICEFMKEDIYSLFEKGLKEPLNRIEKEYFINTYQTSLYTIGIIETKNPTEHLYDILKSMVSYPISQIIQNKKIVLLIPNEIDSMLMMELKDTLETECYCRVYCSCSSSFNDLDNLQNAYQEASLYLNLMIKYDGSYIYANHNDCFFPYIIDSIEEEKAKLILSKIDKNQLNQMDEELLNTIQVFLRNNLSIAETSRQLYLHRNTLIYRLEKIAHITRLDIRNFEDAVKMEILLLLKKRFS